MADFRWAQGSVAGVTLTVNGDPIKCIIIDGANLQPRRFVQVIKSADGTVFTKGFNTEGRGAEFAVRFPNLPVDKFTEMVENINNSIDNNDSFFVELEDDYQVVNKDCKVANSNWLSYDHGELETTNSQFVQNVVMKFITS